MTGISQALAPTKCDAELLASDKAIGDKRTTALSARVRRRKWPLAVALAMVAIGMLYLLYWDPLVHHVPMWATGGDLWGMFRGGQYVSWGLPDGIYWPTDGVVTFPGMPVLLAPIAVLSAKLHLSVSYGFLLDRPTAALVLQPYEMLLASTVVFASDAVAERLGAGQRRRIWLCVLVAAIAWPTAAVWGHGEDALAMTFAIYAIAAVLDGKWTRCGWLLGFGVAVQPLVALLIPLVIGATPSGRRVAVAARSLALSIVLVGIAFAGNASDTYRALVTQPTSAVVNHPTPWIALAPRIPAPAGPTGVLAPVRFGSHVVLNPPQIPGADVLVSGGPGRSVYVLFAVLVGVYIWRRPQDPVRLVWLAAVVLGARCCFEAVMTPYYLAPPLVLALIAVAVRSGKRMWGSVPIALGVSVFAYFHLGPWVWWPPIVAGLAIILALGYPGSVPSQPQHPERTDAPTHSLSSTSW